MYPQTGILPEKLEELELLAVYDQVEMPLRAVLARMEVAGMLDHQQVSLEEIIQALNLSRGEQNALYHSPAKQNSADGGGSSRSADLSVSLYSAYDLRSYYGNERKSGPRRTRLPYLRGCLTRSYSYPLGAVCSYGETVWRRRVQAPQGIRPRGERRAE